LEEIYVRAAPVCSCLDFVRFHCNHKNIVFIFILLEPAGLEFCTVVDSGILVRKENSTKCV
jgi:hypothetical protein